MNKMVRNLIKVAVICAASAMVLASCSKKDINASREMEERYSRASSEIENSAPRRGTTSSVQKAEAQPEVVAPAITETEATAPAAAQPEVSTGTKTAKKGFVQRAVEKTVMKKIERYVEKHPNMKEKYEEMNSIDQNLKMALIFALVAIILSIIAGIAGPADVIFWIASVVCWVIALYFFIMWILTL